MKNLRRFRNDLRPFSSVALTLVFLNGAVVHTFAFGPCGTTAAGQTVQTSTTGQNLLQNPGFEGIYGSTAPGWLANSWGTSQITFAPTANRVDDGGVSQGITLISAGDPSTSGALLKQDVTLQAGHKYQAGIWLRTDSGTVPVEIFLRDDTYQYYYSVYGLANAVANPNWQLVTFPASFNTDDVAAFAISVQAPGTVYVDDASVFDVTPVNDTSVALSQPIPKDYFGMHMICKGCYPYYWPAVNFGIWRLADSGISWPEIEPSQNVYNWTTFDWLILQAENNQTDLIYTLGHVPQWASSQPSAGNYGTYPPANEQDWINYAAAVATRYKGKIKYYELWNEADQNTSWVGTAQQLVTMAQDAYRTIKSIDPQAQVIAPNVGIYGLQFLSTFLGSGGIGSFDLMSIHVYPSLSPENDLASAANMRAVMDSFGLSNVVLLNTEGSSNIPGYSPQNVPATARRDEAMIARPYILNWLNGLSNFDYYSWELQNPYLISLTVNGLPSVLTYAGTAYGQIANWLIGSTMTGKTIGSDGTWEVALTLANGQAGHILWNINGDTTYSIFPSCHVSQASDLRGNTTSISGSSIGIGIAPLLLQ